MNEVDESTKLCRGATKSAAPVESNIGKAQEMQPSVLNSLMGVLLLAGHGTVGGG